MTDTSFTATMPTRSVWDTVQQHWTALLSRVAARMGREGEWQPCYNEEYRFRDGSEYSYPEDFVGSPILDVISREQGRALRIFPIGGAEGKPSITAWLEEERQVPALVGTARLIIRCSEPPGTEVLVEKLMTLWTDPRTTDDEMRAALDGIL